MIILDVTQGTPEWHAARLGIPTASRFSEIITAKTGKPSDSARKYVWELCAEWLLGAPLESASTDFMTRGSALERQAIAAYKLERPGVELSAPGFCLTDDRRAGCSPDNFVDTDGGLEIKCPGPKNHLGYVLDELGDDHRPQVQGCMWITGRSWWDQISFHPELPPALVRFERDDGYIKLIEVAVTALCKRLDAAKARVTEMGFEPRQPFAAEPGGPATDADAMFSPPTDEQQRVANRGKRIAAVKLPDAQGKAAHERHEMIVDYVASVTGCAMGIAHTVVTQWMNKAGLKMVNFGNDEKWPKIAKEVEGRDWVGACDGLQVPV